MSAFALPNWGEIFTPEPSLLEGLVRGTLVYFGLLVILRLVPKRQMGSIGLTDILLLVLVSEAVSAALNLQSKSVTTSLLTVATLAFWNFALDWAGSRWPPLQRLLEACPIPLVRDGRPVRENLERERITPDELAGQLRQQGVTDVSEVKAAFLEPGGQVSVVKDEGGGDGGPAAGRNGTLLAAESECDRRNGNGHPAAHANGRAVEPAGPPAAAGGPPDFDSLLREFLDAARRLQDGAVWHERRAAEHTRAAKEARDALARHGVRPKALIAPAGPADDPDPRDPE